MNISLQILEWYNKNERELPWRLTKDPYKIWLSEIIMQQTQIVQGTSYYLKFVEIYPAIFDLANASEQEILVLWQGLGYYSRARNLHHTAKELVKVYKGKFPETYKELVSLKGIGDYTASAILSICFNKPTPSVDGNVLRVISRLFEIREPINKPSGINKIKKIAKDLITADNPGDFNQALMDFGALQCKPKKPDCNSCFINTKCQAYKNKTVEILPFKEKSKAKTREFFYYFVCINDDTGDLIIRKRTTGIWENLYEFPLVTSLKKLSNEKAVSCFLGNREIKTKIILSDISQEIKHVLSHKELFIKFYTLKINSKTDIINFADKNKGIKIKNFELIKFPFPIIIKKFIEQKFNA